MTPRQREVLDYITAYWSDHGYGPTYREINAALDMKSKSHVYTTVYRMADLGLLTITKDKTRKVRPNGRCPVCGEGG